jgi:arabinofuranosyltransferase
MIEPIPAPTSAARDLALPLVVALGFAAVATWMRFAVDDALINLRCAENLAAGYGPVFNPGEYVEGYTTPAWVFLIGALHRLGAPTLGTAHVLGIAAGSLTVVATGLVAARLAPRLGWRAGALAALLVALHPGVLFWTASGMETAAFMLVVLVAFAVASRGGTPGWAGIACGIALVTRPEAALFTAGLGMAILVREGVGAFLRFAIAPALLGGALELFRLAYFGVPLPNTFYAKVGLQLAHGLWYHWQFVRDGGWIFALAPLALIGPARWTAVVWLALVAAYCAWIVSIGGDFYAFHRFLVPIVPLLAILVALAADRLLGARPRMAGAVVAVVVAAWAATLAGSYAYARSAGRAVDGITAALRPIGLALRRGLPPGTHVAMVAIGAIPYFAGPDVRIVDMLGLTDPHVARDGVRVPDGLPSHARYDNQYVFDRHPELVLIPPPKVWSACRRPITAKDIREDPCGTAFLGHVAIETGLYYRDCSKSPRPACPYALPVEVDLMSPERRAQFETVYERVTELPGLGKINAYRRRDWMP